MKSITLIWLAVLLLLCTAIANATPYNWSAVTNNPAWGTEYSLNFTTLTPNYEPGVDSIQSAFIKLDYSNGSNKNSGLVTFYNYLNGSITGILAFSKNSENTSMTLPATTSNDLSTNGIINFTFINTGSHDFTLQSASFEADGFDTTNTDPAPVPEPGTILLVGTALAGLASLKSRAKTT